MRTFFLLILLPVPFALFAQEKQEKADSSGLRIEGSLFSNAPALPFSGNVFAAPYHPGIDLGLGAPFSLKRTGRWEWRTQIGYYHHALSHHGIHLRGGVIYRQKLGLKGLSWEFALKGGYLHMIAQRSKYELNSNGGYEKEASLGRSQFSAGLATGPAYRFPGTRRWELFINYRFWVQTPFVQEYVPVLPNVAFHFGVRYELPQKNGKE